VTVKQDAGASVVSVEDNPQCAGHAQAVHLFGDEPQ
jgi:hypothetical protein